MKSEGKSGLKLYSLKPILFWEEYEGSKCLKKKGKWFPSESVENKGLISFKLLILSPLPMGQSNFIPVILPVK